MIKRIQEWWQYRRLLRYTKEQLLIMANGLLPSTRTIEAIEKICRAITDTPEEDLVEMLLSELADLLNTSQERLIEIFSYIANLSIEDINNIVAYAQIQTLPEEDEKAE